MQAVRSPSVRFASSPTAAALYRKVWLACQDCQNLGENLCLRYSLYCSHYVDEPITETSVVTVITRKKHFREMPGSHSLLKHLIQNLLSKR